jgi:hypothetical protein
MARWSHRGARKTRGKKIVNESVEPNHHHKPAWPLEDVAGLGGDPTLVVLNLDEH